ncbi:MAG: class I SAM-dependent methyltransferase [Oscillatoria sp. SIO1A7]|nr:class I SAM-dependent methyltransferase [Oscillatoria sp. SIO1A7]
MVNEYTKMTEYYDLCVTSGYYDYEGLAREAHSIVGDGREVLELGVGTGLLAEKYVEIDPKSEFTGVDFSPSMLEIAKKRLGGKAKLIEADVVTMNLNATFDAAISNGGVWVSYDCGDRWEVGSLIPNVEANLPGLVNVAGHLREGGLLLLNVQNPHDNFDKELTSEVVYSQSVEDLVETADYRIVKKNYMFKKDEEILAQEQHKITLFNQDAYQVMFEKAGFDFEEISSSSNGDRFAIYKKR